MDKPFATRVLGSLSFLALVGIGATPSAPAGTVIPGGSRAWPGAAVEAPVFSVWRHLPRSSHVFAELAYVTPANPDYRHSPAPLSATIADSCCAVRPGQALALVRDGFVVARGKVGSLYAADVPAGSDSYRAYFDAEGLPDALVDGRALPYLMPDEAPQGRFDLYVIGDVAITPCAPPARAWEATLDELVTVAAEAVERQAFNRSSLPDSLRPADSKGLWPTPARIAGFWQHHSELAVIDVPLADGTMLGARTVRWRSLDGFARIEGPRLPEPALLSGEIRYFLRIDGVLYVVMIDTVPGTGMWGYFVYRLWPDRAPERVLGDASWST